MNSFSTLLLQIDSFIRKYYKNQLVKGLILLLGVFLLSFLFVTSLEFFGRFNSLVRAILFFTFLLVNSFILTFYVIIPLLKLFSFGKTISREQASTIIGEFFPEISDRLINTLQLSSLLASKGASYELVKASIEQRSKSISAIPFVNGIDLKKNYKYFKWVFPLLLITFLLALFFPKIFTQGTKRVVHYSKEFKMDAPFQFILQNQNFELQEGEDLQINVQTIGNLLPSKVYLVSSEGRFLMQKSTRIDNSFLLERLSSDLKFHFEANGFTSNSYFVKVQPKATIGILNAKLDYPSYIGRKDEFIENIGDIDIPEGTKVTWFVKAKNTSSITFNFGNKSESFSSTEIEWSKVFKSTQQLKLIYKNAYVNKFDSVKYLYQVTKDAFPEIHTQELKDSLASSVRYFTGELMDDYGISQLFFIYKINSPSHKPIEKKKKVSILSSTHQQFNFAFDFKEENLSLNDRIDYYFEVFDNDGVNGPKSSKSSISSYQLPSLEKLNEQRDSEQDLAKENMNKLFNKAQQFEKNVDRLKKDLLNDKSSEWNKLNQLQQLKEQQKSIEKELNSLQNQLNESIENKNELSELDKELMNKQEMIQDLLDKVMDDELKDLLNKLEELMKSNDNENLNKKLEKLEVKSQDMQKQLDRSLELLKKMQVNEKIDAIEKELNELSKNQESLKEKVEQNKIDKENSIKKQDEINNRFKELKEDLKELNKLNDQLLSPLPLTPSTETEKDIQNELNNAKESLEKGNEKKAAKNQQKAASEMKKLSDELNKKQSSANKKQKGEDMESIRLLLENLITLSFNQESILKDFSSLSTNDPSYKPKGRLQRALMDDFKLVEDSLLRLAKRQASIATFIDKELNTINENFNLSIEAIDEHQKNKITTYLQFAMTGINNLALLLNESLQDMQSQMNADGKGDGSCPNPKPGKSGSNGDADDMKELLKKQLEKLEKAQQQGGKKPGSKPGGILPNGKDGEGLSGKEIAKMAAQQSALRQRLDQLRRELNKDGKSSGNQLNPLIKSLEQQEKDLITRNKNADFIKRQKEILTRLLESEEAIREKGFDEKRQSKSGKDYKNSNLKSINEYNQKKLKQIDLIKTIEPVYKKYYKDKSSSYFNEVL